MFFTSNYPIAENTSQQGQNSLTHQQILLKQRMQTRQKQLSFLKKSKTEMGGSNLKGNPRHKRPFHSKKALHLILKSSICKGQFSLLQKKYAKRVCATINYYAKKYGIRIYSFRNVGNHLHLVIQTSNVNFYSNFIRAVTGRIAQVVLKDMGYNSMGGDPTIKIVKKRPVFWDYRPFTRIVEWGRGFGAIKDYMLKNTLDVLNLPRTPTNLAMLKATIGVLKSSRPPPLSLQESFIAI